MKRLPDQFDYMQTENECLAAIDAFKTTNSVKEWLKINESLFNQILIQPKDMPAIIDCHFGGQRYEGIKKFGHLYETVKGVFD
jgi:hypothetical protein